MSKNPETDVLYSGISEFRRVPNDLGRVRKTGYDSKEILRHLEFHNPVKHFSVIFKKKSVLLSGGYPSDMLRMEDYGLWLKMTYEGYKIVDIPQVLVDYRARTKTRFESFSEKWGISHLKSEIKIYEIKRQFGIAFGFKGFGVFILRLLPFFTSRVLALIAYRISNQSSCIINTNGLAEEKLNEIDEYYQGGTVYLKRLKQLGNSKKTGFYSL